MRFSATAALSLLVSSASAAPGLSGRAVCNADACLRAVRASAVQPGPSSGLRDCSSFFAKTVTPCAQTITTTATATVTGDAVTLLTQLYQTATQTAIDSKTVITIVTTVTDTVTLSTPSVVLQSTTVVIPVTVTGTPTQGPQAQGQKRADLVARDASSNAVCPATWSPSAVPSYASACSGTVRYSSACSCAGVTLATVTATPTASTFTTTVTSTLTPTQIATQINQFTQVITVTEMQTVAAALEITAATVLVPSPYTSVVPIMATTTVVVAPPVCSNFVVQLTSGPNTGKYIGDRSDYSWELLGYTGNKTAARQYVLDSAGTVRRADGSTWWLSEPDGDWIREWPVEYGPQDDFPPMVCALPAGKTNQGTLNCQSKNACSGPAIIQNCPQWGYDAPAIKCRLDFSYCATMGFRAVPAC